jgi:hypothetical protein
MGIVVVVSIIYQVLHPVGSPPKSSTVGQGVRIEIPLDQSLPLQAAVLLEQNAAVERKVHVPSTHIMFLRLQDTS